LPSGLPAIWAVQPFHHKKAIWAVQPFLYKKAIWAVQPFLHKKAIWTVQSFLHKKAVGVTVYVPCLKTGSINALVIPRAGMIIVAMMLRRKPALRKPCTFKLFVLGEEEQERLSG
jgi:hypothetical protein